MRGANTTEQDLEGVRLGQGIFFIPLARFHRKATYLIEGVSGRNFSCHPLDRPKN